MEAIVNSEIVTIQLVKRDCNVCLSDAVGVEVWIDYGGYDRGYEWRCEKHGGKKLVIVAGEKS